jgi:hypothetical protein
VDFPRKGGQAGASRGGALKRLGTDAAKMAVATGSIVKGLDVIEDIGTGEVTGFVE